MILRTTDNNCGEHLSLMIRGPDPELNLQHITTNLQRIAGKKVEDPGVLIFPPKGQGHGDKIDEDPIFSLDCNGKLTTGNIMGFIGVGDTTLTITSRFAKEDERDYFLHYMLERVMSINVVKLDTLAGSENIWDFLPMLMFPALLKKALTQGIYRRYRRAEYNDARIRGPIDVARHIRLNIPFTGKVAYNVREYSGDNRVTQLVRHTIEHLRRSPIGSAALNTDPDTKADVLEMENYTPSYNRAALRRVVRENIAPVSHPYFTEYEPLRNLCLQILRREGISFGKDDDKIHGLLFDGAWLWEEYLNKVLGEIPTLDIKHPRNKEGKGGDKLFNDGQSIYPDFKISPKGEETMIAVADAKYKHEPKSEDYYQVIAYMYRYDCKQGIIIFPFGGKTDGSADRSSKIKNERIIDNNAKDSRIIELGLRIPQAAEKFKSFKEFKEEIKKAEGEFKETIIKQILA